MRLIRDREKGGGGGAWGGGEREIMYLSLHYHHQNDFCITMGSDESHLNVSIGSDGQSHRTVSTNHNIIYIYDHVGGGGGSQCKSIIMKIQKSNKSIHNNTGRLYMHVYTHYRPRNSIVVVIYNKLLLNHLALCIICYTGIMCVCMCVCVCVCVCV